VYIVSGIKQAVDRHMLETISEEDVITIRRVLRVLFVLSVVAEFGLAVYSSIGAWDSWNGIYGVGFVLIAVVMWTSVVWQIVFERSCERENALELFQQPCILRWISCAMTWPMQVFVLAWYASIRDVHTLVLLVAIEVVCVLLGFAMEQIWVSVDLEEPIRESVDPMSLSVGRVVRGPQANAALILTQRHKAGVALVVCLFCILVLHVCVWYVVEDALRSISALNRLDTMVHLHCALLSVFWLVSPLQVVMWWLGTVSIEEGLVGASVAYACLDTTAKVQLGVAYALFAANV
jgi:hypothetical protein